jgi:formylglycine-generating enzyme required for sulfatase activity
MSSTASQNHLGLYRGPFKVIGACAILGVLALTGCPPPPPPGEAVFIDPFNGGETTDDGDDTGNTGDGNETLDIGVVQDTGSDLAAIVTSQDIDEALLILGSKRSDGSLRELSGGGSIDRNGRSIFFWFGADGLPARAVFDDLTVFFENYTTNSVDLAAVRPNGVVTRVSGVSLDADLLSDLQSLAGQGATFKGLGRKHTSADTAKLTDQQWSRIVKWTTFGAKAACCAISGGATALGLAPAGYAVPFCCGGVLQTIITETVFTPQPRDAVEFYTQHPEYLASQITLSIVQAESTAEQAEPFAQPDSDGDGVPDDEDGCPNDSNKTSPGNCGCGQLETSGCEPSGGGESDGEVLTETEPNDLWTDANVFDGSGDRYIIRGSISTPDDVDQFQLVGGKGLGVLEGSRPFCYFIEGDDQGNDKWYRVISRGETPCDYEFVVIRTSGSTDGKTPSGETFPLDLGDDVTMVLVRIPAGTFTMGSDSGHSNETPIHAVTISRDFYIGRYEVTQAQWQAVTGSNPSNFSGCDNCPVESVSWYEAADFCETVSTMTGYSIRLPSEAEWEYACRAGSTTEYYFGDDESDLDQYAWWYDTSGDQTHEVGGKLPNAWGLYDVSGNVWEWCQDAWHDDYNGAPSDGSAWTTGASDRRVLRGGSWYSYPGECRSAMRLRSSPAAEDRSRDLGFRVVAGTP